MIFEDFILSFLVLFFSWGYGFYVHNVRSRLNENLIRIPKVLAIIFAGPKTDQLIDFRTMIFQIEMFFVIFLLGLRNLRIINNHLTLDLIIGSQLLLLIGLISMIFWKNGKRRK
jgi:hypothetical protein